MRKLQDNPQVNQGLQACNLQGRSCKEGVDTVETEPGHLPTLFHSALGMFFSWRVSHRHSSSSPECGPAQRATFLSSLDLASHHCRVLGSLWLPAEEVSPESISSPACFSPKVLILP